MAPDMLVVLDRSGSMNDAVDGTSCTGGCGEASKWNLLKTELGAALAPEETNVRWALKLFASSNLCAVTDGVEVAPQFSSAATIAAQLGLVSATTSTPTTAAVSAAAAYLAALADGAPKYIVLVTDGAPTCGSSPCAPGPGETGNQCDDDNAIAAVKQAYTALGIPTFVLGIGVSGPAEATLTQMALAGGEPRAGPGPLYYPVASAADLSAAFSAIAAVAAP